MKKLLATTLILATVTVANAGFVDSVKNFLGLGVNQNTSVKSAVTNSTTVGDTTIGDTTIGSTTQTVNADVIKSFVGSQDASSLFLPLQKANTDTIDFQKKAVDELKNFTERLIKENNSFYETQAKLQREFTQALVDRALQQHVPIYSASSSIPFSLYQNALSTPLYIKDVDSITNTQSLVNSFNNMSSIPTSGSGQAITKSITQTAHGFVVGDWVYLNAGVYTKTDADSLTSLDSVGVVSAVADVNTFTVTTDGYVSGLTGLIAGTRYYLSGTPGTITSTAPTNSKAVLIADSATSGWVQQYGSSGLSAQALTYGRIRANADLANTAFSITSPGTTIPFDATQYSSGATFSGTTGIIPSVTGRYRATWLAQAGSGQFNGNGTFHIVQGGVSLGSVYIDMMEAAGVNQTTPTIDVDVAAGTAVTLQYQPDVADSIIWQRGSYFDLTQLPTAVAPVVNTIAEYIVPQYAAGTVTPSGAQTTSANAAQFMSIAIPTAGTWVIDWSVLGYIWQGNGGGTADSISSALYDSAGALIANSELSSGYGNIGGSAASVFFVQGTRNITVVTTGATTYNVKVWNPAAPGVARASAISNGTTGRSYISANKIAGQLPSTGTTVDYVYAKPTTGTFATNNGFTSTVIGGNIPKVALTGTTGDGFQLTAGKTYSLEGIVMTNSATNNQQVRWFANTVGVGDSPLPESQQGYNMSNNYSSAANSSNVIKAVVTPSSNMVVYLRDQSGNSDTLDVNRSWLHIQQIGSTATIGSGSLPAVDQSSAGYFDIGNMRMQWGTLLHVPSTGPVTFPAPFANTNYTVVVSSAAAVNLFVTTGAKATTNFSCTVLNSGGSPSSNNPISYYAIGSKP